MDSKKEVSKEEVAKQSDPSLTPHLTGEGEDSKVDKEKKRRELRKSIKVQGGLEMVC
jgi:hypothetical protein